MRAIAIIAAFNEERVIAQCLEHHIAQGIEVYLIDNGSTDRTVTIAERYRGEGLIAIESFPRRGVYTWRPLLRRKEELAAMLDADWFLHVDADEFRSPPDRDVTLIEALQSVDAAGYNAVNFLEFTFVPTQEAPDHDHPGFRDSMRWYYPFLPSFPHRLNAWKRQARPVDLTTSGGHVVDFPGLHMFPRSFTMRHYLFLSPQHALEKYVRRRYDPEEVASGWHRKRVTLKAEDIRVPSRSDLREQRGDEPLDARTPRKEHFLFDAAWSCDAHSR